MYVHTLCLDLQSDQMPELAASSGEGPCSSSNRHFSHVTVGTIQYAVPKAYALEHISYLGGGSYGNVIKTRMINRAGEEVEVAIKKLYAPFETASHARRTFRELRLLQLMDHSNVIRAVDIYTPDLIFNSFSDVYIVTEYAGRSLSEYLKRQRECGFRLISEPHARFFIYQLLRAVKYIHSANVIHRDLKPSNLALTEDNHLTVLDFGLARTLERGSAPLSTYVMTRWYRSPEVIYWKIGAYDTKADVWSAGCIAAELLTGQPLFPGDHNTQYDLITRLVGSPDQTLLDKIENSRMRDVISSHAKRARQDFRRFFAGLPPDAIDFIDHMLVLDPERRMSVDEALAHKYMSEYHDDEDEPAAESPFAIQEEQREGEETRTPQQWKGVIWEEIQRFTGDLRSPPF